MDAGVARVAHTGLSALAAVVVAASIPLSFLYIRVVALPRRKGRTKARGAPQPFVAYSVSGYETLMQLCLIVSCERSLT